MKSRNFVLTLWLHQTERCWEEIIAEQVNLGVIRFAALGEEVCPDTGTLHYQAYVVFHNPRARKGVEKLYPNSYVEVMYGSLRSNENYCSKESQLLKFGEEPSQGERTDLLVVKERLDRGEKTMDISEDRFCFPTVAKHSRFFKEYEYHIRSKKLRTDRQMPVVYIRIGEAGTGKTRWLDEQFGPGNWAKMPNPTGNWWITPVVSNSDTVVIDDVGPTKIPKIEEFLEWTDRYPIEFNTKCGFLWWHPRHIVVTSNYPIESWWPFITSAQLSALRRRIHRIDTFNPDGTHGFEIINSLEYINNTITYGTGDGLPSQAQVNSP